jgi:hypothetical protein
MLVSPPMLNNASADNQMRGVMLQVAWPSTMISGRCVRRLALPAWNALFGVKAPTDA